MQRIQKFLSNLGFGSRRRIEQWIISKRLKINHNLAKLGDLVDGTEIFQLDQELLKIPGKYLDHQEPQQLLLYHKPNGKICTYADPLNRPTVFEDLPKLKQGRWISIGRLDLNTSGILLFTNNGELAHQLMHPSFNQEREYLVRAYGRVDDQIMYNLTNGVQLEDGLAKFRSITITSKNATNNWYKVILTEGKNREIKRIFATQDLIVNRLIRIRFGKFCLPKNLDPEQHLFLNI